MSGLPWFRMYTDFMDNEIVEFLSFEDQRHYVFLLCMKQGGLLDKEYPQKGMRDRVISRKLGIHGEAFDNAKKRIMAVGLIDEDWQPLGWNDRQFTSDSAAERQRKYREKKKKQSFADNGDKALRNGDVTVTLQDKDKDKEQIREEKNKFVLPDYIPKDLWKEWMSVRVKKKAVNSDTAKKSLLTKLDSCKESGFSYEMAITTAIEQSWKSIDPEWIKNLRGVSKPELKSVNNGPLIKPFPGSETEKYYNQLKSS